MIKQRWVALGCSHGNEADKGALDWALDFVADYKPHVVFHLGDVFELKALRKGATNEEKAVSIEDDIDQGIDFLERLSRFGSDRYLTLGNHDWRLWEMRESLVGIGRDYAAGLIEEIERKVAALGFSMRPYHFRNNCVKINDTVFCHGVKHSIHADKGMVDDYKANVVFVHTHRPLVKAYPGYPNGSLALNCGCLRGLDPEFASRNTSTFAWGHALGFGEFLSNGTTTHKLMMR